VDNDSRALYFGPLASTSRVLNELVRWPNYHHTYIDVVDLHISHFTGGRRGGVSGKAPDFSLIVHCAAQPSHEWAERQPALNYTVNVGATVSLLEMTRENFPEARFIFMSSIKVYGDALNDLDFEETDYRYDLPCGHLHYEGFTEEDFTHDSGARSIFGASKAAADTMVIEYGKCYGMRTTCLRAGCVTGMDHRGVPEHGMLSHLVNCVRDGKPYTINGYGGKQVRDQLWVDDLVDAVMLLADGDERGEAYNIGGGRGSACSILDALRHAEACMAKRPILEYAEARKADHKWWITSPRKFMEKYPQWRAMATADEIIKRLCAIDRLRAVGRSVLA